ncbi:MAG: hypothetical protein JWN04_3073 [Myxococcaceae bacterium]|nr:hypothetical protein [Myxococcaceae bacterium]
MKLLDAQLVTLFALAAACSSSDDTCTALGGMKVEGICTCPPGTTQGSGSCVSYDSGFVDSSVAAPTDAAATRPSDAGPDDATTSDAATSDAAGDAGSSAQSDSSVDGGSDAGVACPIQNARFGCGTAVSTNWVVFQSGVEIDRPHHLAWSPPFEFTSTADLAATCDASVLGGITDWDVPDIVEVRTMAAGCEGTIAYIDGAPPNSSQCSVRYGFSTPTSTGECSCTTPMSPRADGLNCGVDVPTCVTVWTKTTCGDTCSGPKNWFYLVETGAIVLADSQAAVARSAKARCVTYIPDGMVP